MDIRGRRRVNLDDGRQIRKFLIFFYNKGKFKIFFSIINIFFLNVKSFVVEKAPTIKINTSICIIYLKSIFPFFNYLLD